MKTAYLVIFTHAMLFCLGVIAGFHDASNRCEIEKQKFEHDLAVQNTEVLSKKNATENVFKDAVIKSQSDLFSELNSVNARYNDLVDTTHNVNADRVHADSPSSETNMSDSATAPARIPVTQCKCTRENTKEFQRLYKEQLLIARDCDITTTYYNKVLELYNSISK